MNLVLSTSSSKRICVTLQKVAGLLSCLQCGVWILCEVWRMPRNTQSGQHGSCTGDTTAMTGKHKRQPSEVVTNKNVSWLNTPAVWAWYIGLVVLSYFVVCAVLQDAGLAWTYVHLIHGVVTYYLLHWLKGTPFADEDQGQYCRLTFWEQVDNGVYGTSKRKLFTAMPVILFLLATNGTDFRKQPLGLNLACVLVCVIAKLPALHKVRIWGINKY